MNGVIKFNDLNQLADFLKAFTGSTAIFEVRQCETTKRWILEFTGGY
jgi:hypothetical protein